VSSSVFQGKPPASPDSIDSRSARSASARRASIACAVSVTGCALVAACDGESTAGFDEVVQRSAQSADSGQPTTGHTISEGASDGALKSTM
jgi:hypothetical protein